MQRPVRISRSRPLPTDAAIMRAALSLAERGRFHSAPNPHVAAIIVKDGHIIGRGVTAPGGRPHAEAIALQQAGDAAKDSTIYVTLEPCAHQSERGPSCASLIAQSGAARVVVATRDSDPRTNGQGIAALKAAGLDVTIGLCEAEARFALAGFFMQKEHGRPFVTLKLATSLDGRIALADGRSKWITGDAARAHSHIERARHDAILVGGGTLRADDPGLDVRLPGLENTSPHRYVLTRGDAPEGWHKLPSPDAIRDMQGTQWLMVEGGAATAAAFVKADLVDRLLIYRAPIIIGEGLSALGDIGLTDLADAHGRWQLSDTRMLGNDRMESYHRIEQ